MANARTPVIGVTGHWVTHGTSRDLSVRERYVRGVVMGGGVPVVLAPETSERRIGEVLDDVDGVLLTGGNDIDPALWGERVLNDTVRIDEERDAFELPLARLAVERDLPVLAICRGCQVLNVALGGSLWQDIPTQIPTASQHRQHAPMETLAHDVWVAEGSRLATVLGTSGSRPVPVNTSHHQAVRLAGAGLHSSAYCKDGVIEAVEAPERRFVLGVQWHPEWLAEAWPEHRRLFEALVQAARVD